MPAGCPRTVSPPPREVIALGNEMVAWVEEHKPLHISFWWRAEKGMNFNTWKTLIQRKEFIPYYDRVMGNIAQNYINGNVNPSLAQRFLRIYFGDVKEEEDEALRYRESLRSQADTNTALAAITANTRVKLQNKSEGIVNAESSAKRAVSPNPGRARRQ